MLELMVSNFIIEKNLLELVDGKGNRFYYKGGADEKIAEKFFLGEMVVFKNGTLKRPKKGNVSKGQLSLEIEG